MHVNFSAFRRRGVLYYHVKNNGDQNVTSVPYIYKKQTHQD